MTHNIYVSLSLIIFTITKSAAGENFEMTYTNTSGFAVKHKGFLFLFVLNPLRKMIKFLNLIKKSPAALISLTKIPYFAYFPNEIPYFPNFG